ncbi:MAG TPA: glycosyltransferase family 9 protein, partial [Nevskia sp.]|nr:glycosyltransferase family 9 protein [Nevskia sp.]
MSDPAEFYALTRDARKVLAIENPALGDSIHLLPALKRLRESYHRAQLQVVAGAPSFFRSVAPWVDLAWPEMPRRPIDNRALIASLRRERIDAVFVFSGHNRAGVVANLIGARHRVGRRTDHKKPWWWQPLLYTHTVNYPWHGEPMFRQHLQLLKACGLPGDYSEAPGQYGARVLPEWFDQCGMSAGERKTYLHISPYYSYAGGDAGRELPLQQYVDLLTRLRERLPRVILSCGPSERERTLLKTLVENLPFTPWRVYAGDLSLNQYIALVDGACLHLGGDSGGTHVARMLG